MAPDGKSIIQPNLDMTHTAQGFSHQGRGILNAVIEAHVWRDMMIRDNLTIQQLTKQVTQPDNFIYRRLKLLNLSPKLLRLIMAGALPITISLKNLYQASQYLKWDKQHQFLGV